MQIGEKIKAIRKEKGIAQKDLAENMGVSAAMIAQYEAGKRSPKYETLKRFAEALGVSILSLVDDEFSASISDDEALTNAVQAVGTRHPNLRLTTTDSFFDEVGKQMYFEDIVTLDEEAGRLNHFGMTVLIAYARFLASKEENNIERNGRYNDAPKEATGESVSNGGGNDNA